ncbi:hypothetical protein ACOME3_004968 [Neoechinorhynchus agilis]
MITSRLGEGCFSRKAASVDVISVQKVSSDDRVRTAPRTSPHSFAEEHASTGRVSRVFLRLGSLFHPLQKGFEKHLIQYVCEWREGKCLHWDATCVDTLAVSNILYCLEIAGGAAKGRKWSAWQLGTFSAPGSLEEIERSDARAGVFLLQNISLAVQRGNAASAIATAEEGEKLQFFGRW